MSSNIVLCFLISLALKWHLYKHLHIKITTNHTGCGLLAPLPRAAGGLAGTRRRSGAEAAPRR